MDDHDAPSSIRFKLEQAIDLALRRRRVRRLLVLTVAAAAVTTLMLGHLR